VLGLALAVAASVPRAQSWAWDDGSVPFVVSPEEVVDRMVGIARTGPGDFLIDLGSGDGRIVIEAARRGANALGVDIDPSLVARSRDNAARAGVSERARFETRDLFETDLSRASVITMYLLPEFNLKLMPRLLALKPGTRVVSHDWDMGAWEPDETVILRTPEKTVGAGLRSHIYLWVVPADARGSWRSALPGQGGEWQFKIAQNYQALEIEARFAGRELTVRGHRLRGAEIKIAVTGRADGAPAHHLFQGTVQGGRITGTVRISDGDEARTLPWIAARIP
jgi:SAM-dependent methyltransferase